MKPVSKEYVVIKNNQNEYFWSNNIVNHFAPDILDANRYDAKYVNHHPVEFETLMSRYDDMQPKTMLIEVTITEVEKEDV